MRESKHDLIQQVIAALQADLDVLRKAAMETHRDSTSAESKAEGKYDTRGLEASYLAEAQAGQVLHLEESVSKLKQLSTDDLNDDQPIAPGCMVIVSNDYKDFSYMMLPAGGGMSLKFQGLDFIVITPDSPIGSALLGKHLGNNIELPKHGKAYISDLW